MDIDMHFYGTYALARAAGIRADCAIRIATASEFVDDSVVTETIVHPDGARFRGEATAHHSSFSSLIDLNNRDNQQQVWVPFHFLPGAQGDTQSQKLICRKDSLVARNMVDRQLEEADKPFALELLGITAHVYADTFAHYGFSGVSSRVNRIREEALKLVNGAALAGPLSQRFFAKFGEQGKLLDNFRQAVAGLVAEESTGALGHGAAATLPDQPYLEWRYSYEKPELAGATQVERQNAKDFDEGATALHGMFRRFAERRPLLTDKTGGFDFENIRPEVHRILSVEAPREERVARWKAAIATGTFSRSGGEVLADYDGAKWHQQTLMLKNLEKPEMASQVPVYQFHQAAAIHRNYILRDLLPHHGIYII